MSTFRRAKARQATRAIAAAGVAFAVIAAPGLTAAQAQETRTGGCIGGWGSTSCVTRWTPNTDPFVRPVPQPDNRVLRSRAVERDRRWVARCRPVVRPDRYGVGRYRYATPGCEFGVGEY